MRTAFSVCGVLILLSFLGCTTEEIIEVVGPSELSPPLGLFSITGDEGITLFWWCSNYENDLDGYYVYYKQGETVDQDPQENIPSGFEIIDSVEVTTPCAELQWLDIDTLPNGSPLANGTTYSFLVVAAMDNWAAISNTSNIIEDTPRNESAGEDTIYAYQDDETEAGFELSNFTVVSCVGLDVNYDTPSGIGDIMCEQFNPGAGVRAWIDGINGGEIQDIGYMNDWNDADEAPGSGYAETGHSVEALMGHVYAIKTGNNHYGKIQITGIDASWNWIRFRAAYQPDTGNPEYK